MRNKVKLLGRRSRKKLSMLVYSKRLGCVNIHLSIREVLRHILLYLISFLCLSSHLTSFHFNMPLSVQEERTSIHTASTGPSKIIHFLFSDPSFKLFTQSLTILGTRPSFHSFVIGLNSPYSSPAVMLFGLSIRQSTCL